MNQELKKLIEAYDDGAITLDQLHSEAIAIGVTAEDVDIILAELTPDILDEEEDATE